MKTIEYWEVTESFDRDSKLIGNFSSELVANQVVAKSKGYRSSYRKVLTVFDTVEDFENNTRDKIRARALAKLTLEERNALGFK